MVHTLQWNLITLNNKSRKGLYVYITARGQRGRYYKVDDDLTLDPLLSFYEDTYLKKKPKGTLHAYKQQYTTVIRGESIPQTAITRKAHQTLTKGAKISGAFKKGVIKYTSTHFLTKDGYRLNDDIQRTLQPLILHKRLLKIMSTQENLNKIRLHLQHNVTLLSRDGTRLATATIFKHTPYEVQQMLRDALTMGTRVEKKSPHTIRTNLSEAGFKNYTVLQEGVLGDVAVEIVFRKGK